MGYLVDDCCISGSEVFVIKYNNRNDHISLYLKVADTTSLPFGWEVNAQFSFLELDQLRDKYLTIWNYTPFLSVKDRMEGAPVALFRRFQRCFYGISH
ncbi:Ubiquitin carboxyl-terminal hydrolase 12 -like protein [Gossypium arboreum]|uniref:Ubiquitin carboxyl-terminal hydrolase 12-like protein n=2 Tax=Gossypium TaxID=3633 RepID=A0A0B0N2T7_GOSAR|nr:Ubiquitin carboxyl-terminal hydrolase 12 -like protein [Gossypium arboreum]